MILAMTDEFRSSKLYPAFFTPIYAGKVNIRHRMDGATTGAARNWSMSDQHKAAATRTQR